MCPDAPMPPDESFREIRFPSSFVHAKGPEQEVLDRVRQCRYSCEDLFAVQLALEEALTNAIRHGNGGDPSKQVTLRYCVTPDKIILRVADEGAGFQPETLPDPTADDRLECPSGRGVMLMHAYMTRVFYNKAGNEVTLIKIHR